MATLAEIKAQNEQEAVQTQVVSEQVQAADESGEKPFWLADEEPEEQNSEEEQDEGEQLPIGKSAPVSALVKLKKKLKGQISEKDEELERLRAELHAVKTGAVTPQQTTQAPKRPRNADFDTDEEYESAMDKYEDDKLKYQTQLITSTQSQSTQVEQRTRKILASVDNHYERAAKLVESSGINPEVYQQATENFKSILERAMPGKSEGMLNGVIDIIGEGSEKTIFYIGRNKTAQNEFAALLAEDPTGLKASMWLGRTTEKINGTVKKTSQAPSPSAQLKSGGSVTAKESAYRKKYEEAHKKGSLQDAYNAKKDARKAGIDTSNWM
jgi:hypothetical protein